MHLPDDSKIFGVVGFASWGSLPRRKRNAPSGEALGSDVSTMVSSLDYIGEILRLISHYRLLTEVTGYFQIGMSQVGRDENLYEQAKACSTRVEHALACLFVSSNLPIWLSRIPRLQEV
jgi:hypothetical protein